MEYERCRALRLSTTALWTAALVVLTSCGIVGRPNFYPTMTVEIEPALPEDTASIAAVALQAGFVTERIEDVPKIVDPSWIVVAWHSSVQPSLFLLLEQPPDRGKRVLVMGDDESVSHFPEFESSADCPTYYKFFAALRKKLDPERLKFGPTVCNLP
jgi:hypothetical protein